MTRPTDTFNPPGPPDAALMRSGDRDKLVREASYHVTGRAFSPLLLLADQKEWDQGELLSGLPMTEAEIRDASSLIPWSPFVEYCERFEDKLGGPENLSQMGEALVPSYSSMARFLGLMASPSTIYRWVNRWAGPNLFPLVSQTTEELEGNRIRVVLSLPSTVRDCPTFFRITGESFRVVPMLIGLPPAAVEAKLSERSAAYVITLPPSGTLLARVKRAFSAFFSGAQVLDELVSQHDRLVEGHRELHAAHLDLERSERNFRSVLERAPIGAMVLGPQEIRYANEAMNRFLRLPERESLEGRPIEGYLTQTNSLKRFLGQLEEDSAPAYEIEFRAEDGELAVGEVRAITTNWDGEEARLLVCQDVTERNRVMSRALALDRMIAVGTLAAGVAHEINNPLAYVYSNLEYAVEAFGLMEPTLKQQLPPDRLEKVEQALRESLQGTARVRDIVRDLKSFSRPPEETLEMVDAREVCKAAINMAWHEVRRTAKVRSEFDDVPALLGNSARLGQVVLNLLVNAAQAFPAGKEDHNFITVRTLCRDGHGIIEVEDNGIGIPPESLRRVFDPFYTTKPLGVGTGMGLWISHDIVTRLGGKLEVESEKGRGTRFRIVVPLAPPQEEVAAVFEPHPALTIVPTEDEGLAEPSVARQRAEFRVLVIDDEPMIGRLVQRILAQDVLFFSDPHEALRHLRDDEDFDVVLCDSTMPGMTGREFYRRLQHEFTELAPRFVLITGGLTSSWQEDPDSPPILTKPFSMNTLRQMVRQVGDAEAAE